MSRPTTQRSLTLTEELEKLEQQITLTLQEIDSNFSKAHRIVTTSILPIVEEYAKHSNEVWEGSKFWKQFFEASANVSLDGYEENADESVTNAEATESFQTPTNNDDDDTVTGAQKQQQEEDEFSLESPTQVTGVQSTPRLPPSTAKRSNGAGSAQPNSRPTSSYTSPSPRKYTGSNPMAVDTSEEPSTPRMNPAGGLQSSPFEPQSAYQPSVFQPSANRRPQNNDTLLHRAILDKNYRIQATPHTQQRRQQWARKQPDTKATPATATKKAPWDDSPQSSPAIAAPQLRSELFSPAKAAPRTPGRSILTPAAKKSGLAPRTSTGMQLFSPDDKAYTATQERTRGSLYFDDTDETDDLAEMSPPKTMQFHVPQSRLMQTPAREASKKIVDDLLLTAGADATDDIEDDDDGLFDDPSPSVVRRAYDVDDDTF